VLGGVFGGEAPARRVHPIWCRIGAHVAHLDRGIEPDPAALL
jgi:hypothetical protein